MKLGIAVWVVILTASHPLSSFGQAQAAPDLVAEFLGSGPRRPAPARLSSDDPFALPELPPGWAYKEAAPPRTVGVDAGGLDFLVAGPGEVLGSVAGGLRSMGTVVGPWSTSGEPSGSVFTRVLGSLNAPAEPFSVYEFTEDVFDREAKYFRQRPDAQMTTPGFDDDEEEMDIGHFSRDQRKVVTHALGRYYLGPYSTGFNESVRREAFDFSCWSSTDFFAGPMLLGGYLYLRGWDSG